MAWYIRPATTSNYECRRCRRENKRNLMEKNAKIQRTVAQSEQTLFVSYDDEYYVGSFDHGEWSRACQSLNVKVGAAVGITSVPFLLEGPGH